ncbi:MAG: hypothetical protein U0269_36880 [Polyangiales bacterium]
MRVRISPVFLLTICALSNACGGGVPSADASSDATTDASAVSDSATTSDSATSADASDPDAASCTNVASGAEVTSVAMMAASPTPMGGTIADGDYQLVSAAAYYQMGNAPAPRTLAGALRFRSNTVALVLTERGSTLNTAGTFTTTDTNISLAWACPRMAPARGYPYTATPTRFDWFLPPNLVLTYMRQ